MRIALAQINPKLGDFKGNAQKILDYSKRALEKRAALVVFSEMALFGYPANDLLEKRGFVKEQQSELKRLLSGIPKGITVVFGAVISNSKKFGKPFSNVAVIARKGAKPIFVAKQLLPSYDIFDETRFFEPGDKTHISKIPGIGKVAVTVCEDMWGHWGDGIVRYYQNDPISKIKGLDLVVNISASPFSEKQMQRRLLTAKNHVKKTKAPFVYVNQIGGQDELIFDGRSFVLDSKGREVVRGASCEEDLVMIDLGAKLSEYRPQEDSETETLRKALVLGIRDFVLKTGQSQIHLGLSGGIDSAVAACLAVDAVGPQNVTGLLLPGPYSSQGSVDDATTLAKNLRIKTHTVNINSLFSESQKAIKSFTDQIEIPPTVEQNIQARLRGLALMAFSNTTGSMLLTTANKSEIAAGYSTLYGDLTGGLGPLGDLVKGKVYELAHLYNHDREIIPQVTIKKAPSAELAPGQKDQDTLPPYDDLDESVEKLVEKKKAPQTKTDQWLEDKLLKYEFKRWQSPPILRVTDHAFGRGRRMPISFHIKAKKSN